MSVHARSLTLNGKGYFLTDDYCAILCRCIYATDVQKVYFLFWSSSRYSGFSF